MSSKKWSERSRWFFSWRTSLVIHAALLVIVFDGLWILSVRDGVNSKNHRFAHAAQIRTEPKPGNWIADSDTELETHDESVGAHTTTPSSESALDPRWEQIVQSGDSESSDTDPSEGEDQAESPEEQPDSAASLLAKQVTRSIQSANGATQAENLEKLSRLSKQLSDKSTEANVDAMNKTLNRMLGTRKRASTPKKPIVGHEFDVATAQLHEIEKRVLESGKTEYVLTLIDASGQTFQITLTTEEGEQIYRVMQIVKANPLLEQLYRGVVMGLLDDLLKSGLHKPQGERQSESESENVPPPVEGSQPRGELERGEPSPTLDE